MTIKRKWAMPSRWTFTIKPIKELLVEEVIGDWWIDPFAGKNSLAKTRNDIDPEIEAEYHLDALAFLKMYNPNSVDGVLYDPPYSMAQSKSKYGQGFGALKYWADCKDEVARIIKPGGKAICFGWNSNGLGKGRGFELQRMLIVAHGGSKNDTIATVETKS